MNLPVGVVQSFKDVQQNLDGLLKLLTSRFLQLAGPGATKTLWGLVTGAGAVGGGGEFTVVRTAQGFYTVTFTTAFKGVPAVTYAPHFNGTAVGIRMGVVSATGFTVWCYTVPGLADTDMNWHFHATGPA